MEGHIVMSRKERLRKAQFEMVAEGRKTLKEACEVLGLSYRQGKRSYSRFRQEGDRGLVHRGRGRASNRAGAPAFRKKVLERYRRRYGPLGFGPTLAAEKLCEEGLEVDHETLRRWLLDEKLWHRRRKRSRHRSRREPRARFGELVQLDGSHHRWFGPERAQCCLMSLVDDATGTVLAQLAEEETTEAAMRLVWAWVERYGVPEALYCDRKSVYVTDREPTLEEQLAHEQPLTAFGKACNRLGIAIVEARSPQAKGRVERKHGVFQDRFVKELALRRIATAGTARALLENGFVEDINARFAKPPAQPEDAHRPVPATVHLAGIFCHEHTRVLANDWTIQFQGRCYQVLAHNKPLPRPKDKIGVRVHLDGALHLLYRNAPLEYRLIAPRQRRQNAQDGPNPRQQKKPQATPPPGPAKSKNNTPWRQGATTMFADTKKKAPP